MKPAISEAELEAARADCLEGEEEGHLVPNEGNWRWRHSLSMDCWCMPERDWIEPLVVLHRLVN